MYRRVKKLNKNIGKLQIKTLRYIHLSKAAVNTQGERNESNLFPKTQQNLLHKTTQTTPSIGPVVKILNISKLIKRRKYIKK
jgi:hypothetical protein